MPELKDHSAVSTSETLPFSLPLELTVQDSDTIRELVAYSEGESREQFAVKALRIGVLALRQARGEFDAEQVRRESERLLETLRSTLEQHSSLINTRLAGTLKEYFDPASGRFHERVERLIKKDGELEDVLRRQVGNGDSELSKTLAGHFGEDSDLMRTLSPDNSKGVLFAFRATLDDQLQKQRDQVLKQFSLDNKEGALARFIGELTNRQSQLSDKLHGKLDEVVQEFSLDQEDSALSRLVRNVDRAQRTITSEFSLDEESSALSRLKKLLEDTNRAIDGHLSLDNEDSALARLRREMSKLLVEQRETNQKFQEEVKVSLKEMVARRKEAQRSTRHGLEFEDAVYQQLQAESQRVGDIAEHTGNTTGQIKNCKVGDCVIQLGSDCAAAGARIVVEAKEKAGYTLAAGLNEIETARKNRDAQVGLFVISQKTAPDGIEPFARHGNDVLVVWDIDTPESDLYLRTGITLARALCVRSQKDRDSQAADFAEIDAAILEIEKRTDNLQKVAKWAETIRGNAEQIIDHIRISRKSLEKQVASMQETISDLKSLLADAGEAGN